MMYDDVYGIVRYRRRRWPVGILTPKTERPEKDQDFFKPPEE